MVSVKPAIINHHIKYTVTLSALKTKRILHKYVYVHVKVKAWSVDTSVSTNHPKRLRFHFTIPKNKYHKFERSYDTMQVTLTIFEFLLQRES